METIKTNIQQIVNECPDALLNRRNAQSEYAIALVQLFAVRVFSPNRVTLEPW